MLIDQRGDSLDLENDFFIANEIRGKCLNKCTPAILQSLRWFRKEGNSSKFELNCQALVVNRFEKTAALIFVNSKAGADDGVAFRFVNQFRLLLLFVSFSVFRGLKFQKRKTAK